MLSRLARGLYSLGRVVERSQHVARILEVNHKMSLERSSSDDGEIWSAISESFDCELTAPDERSLYGELVLSADHPYSVLRCISEARDEGRSMREQISEEMWIHLNRTHLELQSVTYERVIVIGRSEFNRRVEVFADALHGLADDTMIRDDSWAFLRLGKFTERARMVCRILEIKRKSVSSDLDGGPVDVHQWQALLRSLSGYEPYRRAYDARVVPPRVLEFVLQRSDFPRSLFCALLDIQKALAIVSSGSERQAELDLHLVQLMDEIKSIDTSLIATAGLFEIELGKLEESCSDIEDAIELAYFTSLRPSSVPILVSPGAGLVSQQ